MPVPGIVPVPALVSEIVPGVRGTVPGVNGTVPATVHGTVPGVPLVPGLCLAMCLIVPGVPNYA
jgi:hypothetical protein